MVRVNLELRKIVVCLIDYNTICYYVKFKLFKRLLNKKKEFILENERSQRMWNKKQLKGFKRRIITFTIYKIYLSSVIKRFWI
jgi:hypothetical protein